MVALGLAVVVGLPLALSGRAGAGRGDDAAPGTGVVIVVTPHTQQIREEFGEAFARWHMSTHGSPARVDWRTPGGTSEIRKLLVAGVTSTVKQAHADGRLTLAPARPVTPTERDRLREAMLPPASGDFDVMFGGGSFEHDQLKAGALVDLVLDGKGERIRARISSPIILPQPVLARVYGGTPMDGPGPNEARVHWVGTSMPIVHNRIGAQLLYDPDGFWLGTALSGFGIVFNRDALHRLGLPEPEGFEDLADPRLQGWVALADPRQSGSVTTTFDSILGNNGWTQGWRLLREMSANARYFANSATKIPIDVGHGEAAVGLAIDFYGRSQAGAMMREGETPRTARVGYVDPAGATYIDADPVSLLAGAPNPEMGRRFVEFCLTPEAQALWQYRAGEDGGPARHELRRLPIRRDFYTPEKMERFVDQVNPFELASSIRNPGWRTAVEVMMPAFSIENAELQREAWEAVCAAAGRPNHRELWDLFHSWPATPVEDPKLCGAFRGLSAGAKERFSKVRSFADLGVTARRADDLSPEDRAIVDKLLSDGPDELPFTEGNYRTIRETWRDPMTLAKRKIEYSASFRRIYREVIARAGERP